MKRVLLIRHAKSSWDDITMKDFDRPLNPRGLRDAPAMAKRLVEQGVDIDGFISSPALRAITTCTIFARAYGKEGSITTRKELYEPTVKAFGGAIKKADDEHNTIAIFAHNPGITEFANSLTNTQVDDMPTCAIFAVQAAITSWADFESAVKTFWFFDYPKNG